MVWVCDCGGREGRGGMGGDQGMGMCGCVSVIGGEGEEEYMDG